MSIAQALLAEFEQEAKTTRRFLERLPEDKLAWKPHEKSMSAGQLALHIASLTTGVVQLAQLDMAPAPDFGRQPPEPKNAAEVLAAHDQGVAKVREVLPTFTDERMHAIWKLTKDGRELLAIRRVAFLRSVLLNHWYHHRGQFGVYLRLLGAKVPVAYGPSGDEAPDFLKAS